jgi:hypothetical protein
MWQMMVILSQDVCRNSWDLFNPLMVNRLCLIFNSVYYSESGKMRQNGAVEACHFDRVCGFARFSFPTLCHGEKHD